MQLRIDDRTLLRTPRLDDAPRLFALIDRDRAYLREWLRWVDDSISTDHTRNFLRGVIDAAADGKSLILVLDHESEPCGTVGFNWIDPMNGGCEIGYWLREDRQGRGLVTSACRALVGYAFDELHLNCVRIAVAVGNARSRRIPERLGFHLDGVIREAERLHGGFVDHALYTYVRRDRDG